MRLPSILFAAAALIACKRTGAPAAPLTPVPAATIAPANSSAPTAPPPTEVRAATQAVPKIAPGHGVPAQAALPPSHPAISTPEATTVITGKVLERLDASTYSYLRLKTGDKEIWAAVPQTNLAVGAEATLLNPMDMGSFESKTLKRTFDQIYFATLKN